MKQFGGLLTGAQFELYSFICILMEGEADAADVLQDTNLALWNKAEQYDPAQPFMPWARSFAYNQVRAFRLKQSRSRLVFDEDLLDWFATHAQPAAGADLRDSETLGRLEECLGKLGEMQRRLIRLKYTDCASLKEIAAELGHTVSSVGVMLHRTRQALADCMRRGVRTGGVS
ncbi:MAG: sigma-70 family RNA polymerase sigma factor [Kiritimatiellae bacterium]|nr:sigma-70 family RNA polymerase sigma factor [Kiritimatiellia bacterium]